jgi:hypothetical protein
VVLNQVDVTGSMYPVHFYASGTTGGTVNQNVEITDLVATGGLYDGLGVIGFAVGGTVNQTVDAFGVELTNNGHNGLYVLGASGNVTTGGEGSTTYPGQLAQYVTIGKRADQRHRLRRRRLLRRRGVCARYRLQRFGRATGRDDRQFESQRQRLWRVLRRLRRGIGLGPAERRPLSRQLLRQHRRRSGALASQPMRRAGGFAEQ